MRELARLAAIVQSSDDAIISKTLAGVVLTWNPAAERIFGYSSAEMVGSTIYRLVPPELHPEEQEVLERVSRGQPVSHFETTRVRKDGIRIPVDLTVSPVRDASGAIVGASSVKRDISDRMRAAETASRLAAIVQSSDDAVLSKKLDGTVVDWNSAAERMYGIPADVMIGRSIYTVVPQDLQGEEQSILQRVGQGEHVAHYETVRLRNDGSRFDVSLTLSPIRDSAGKITGASSIQRDITASKRFEESRRQASKMEAIGVLAGGLAHDFNNQLHAVSGFAHFVSRDPGLSPASRADLIELQKTTERMASLTRQLLAFSRQQILSPEILDLDDAVRDTHPMLQRLIGSNTPIRLSLSPGSKWVRVDRAQLVQVLLNLVINARDAMPEGGQVDVRTETLEVSPGNLVDIAKSPVEAGAYAELSVEDNGEGILPQHLQHIFEPFYTTKDIGHGTGLGLATVEGIVSQSGGRIRLQSAVGQGTTIRILFPLTAEPAAKAPGTEKARTPGDSRGRILVVDDEDAVRAVVSRALQNEGYEVLRARDGDEALRELEEIGGTVDLVLTDVIMPNMGGAQLGRELAARYPKIPMVWMSGHPGEAEFPREMPAKYRAFLLKPVAADTLIETVARVLEQARA